MDIREVDGESLLASYFVESPAALANEDDTAAHGYVLSTPLPTSCRPGTPEKIAVLQERFELGLDLWNEHDERSLHKLTSSVKRMRRQMAEALAYVETVSPISERAPEYYYLDWLQLAKLCRLRKAKNVVAIVNGKVLCSVLIEGLPNYKIDVLIQALTPISIKFDSHPILVPCTAHGVQSRWGSATVWPSVAIRELERK